MAWDFLCFKALQIRQGDHEFAAPLSKSVPASLRTAQKIKNQPQSRRGLQWNTQTINHVRSPPVEVPTKFCSCVHTRWLTPNSQPTGAPAHRRSHGQKIA